jgi:PucR family transcriptional regulator, purine catabolism regulatory protein
LLTLQDLAGDLGLRLVAGEPGAGADVRWVHSSELLDPTPWLSGGELLLTTGLLLGTPEEQREYVARLVAHGLAGVGFGVGFAHAEVPAALAEAAEAMGFPVYEIPYALPFIAVTEQASTHIVNAQFVVLQRALARHERLERVVLSEHGLEGVTATLGELIGGPAAIFDARGEHLAGAEIGAAAAAEVAERVRGGARRGFAAGETALALPVARTPSANGNGPAPQAWLVAAKADGALAELDRLTVHQAVTVVALELLQRRIAHDTERRLAGDVLAGLLSAELAGAELGRRLEPFGLRGRVSALVFALPREHRRAAEEALGAALAGEAGLLATAGALTCVLLPGLGSEDETFAAAEALRAQASAAAGSELEAGVGRPASAGDARRSYHEARCALEARGMGQAGGPPLATYRQLGSFQLLLALQDDEALTLFCDSILGPIEAGEGAYGGELMRSLEAFIECNGQWERAARQLYCHRHTLRYRVRRIEELTGRSLDSARDRIDFWLALRGRELTRSHTSKELRT